MRLAIAIHIHTKKMSMCFCSVPLPFSSDVFFFFFFFRVVNKQKMKPYIKLRRAMTSWIWTLVSFKRKLKCNATSDIYECVLAHFQLYYFYYVFFSFSFFSNFSFLFSKEKSICDFATFVIRAMSYSIKCQTNNEQTKCIWQKVQHSSSICAV